ncbi:MAG: lipocalin-like domain-containing protein [Thermodesulfovibrionales bacterium]
MKGYVKGVTMTFLFITIISVGTLFGASDVSAQDMGLTQQIQGSWVLVSMYNDRDGKKTELFGPNPKGFMILTPEGRFSMILINANLPKFASNIRLKGTAEENKAIVQGSLAYFGTYKVADEKANKVTLNIEKSTYPNWDGQEQQRSMTVIGDEMMFISTTTTVGGGTNYLAWKRVK